MKLYHCVYYSRSDAHRATDLREIVEISTRNNTALGVTGALFLAHGHFFQIIEGSRTAISHLLFRIALDDRHDDVTLVLFEPIPARLFSDWSMAGLTLATPGIDAIFRRFTEDVRDLTELSGPRIFDMLLDMVGSLPASSLSLGRRVVSD